MLYLSVWCIRPSPPWKYRKAWNSTKRPRYIFSKVRWTALIARW